MFSLLLSGDSTVVAAQPARAQLPLLLTSISELSSVPVGLPTETDTALSITVVGGTSALTQLPLLLAFSTGTGSLALQVGQTSESDTALPITVIGASSAQSLSIGLVEEADAAFSVTPTTSGNVFIAVGITTETDTAFTVLYRRSFLSVVRPTLTLLVPHVDAINVVLVPVEVD
ncbi:MAG: hypothetical protein H0U59_04720 [Gemmatimonadaceae bacterium]|nr:hypothetical protein [Gemmatimonadaceae bacterium]